MQALSTARQTRCATAENGVGRRLGLTYPVTLTKTGRRVECTMPESPDFEQIAREIDRIVTEYARTTLDLPAPVPAIIEQLRQVWNARGAADRALLDGELSSQMGSTAAGPYVKNLDRALRSLDR